MNNISVATMAIILINGLVSFKGFNDTVFFDRFKFSIKAIKAGQKERMCTSGFLHADISHLLFNMLTLYFFSEIVIGWFGSIKFLGIYFISLIAGSLLAFVFHRNEPYYTATGASGAVTGILYSAILLQPAMRLGIMFIPIPLPAYVLGIGYLLYAIYGIKSRQGNIGHTSHFGGAVGGYLTTLILMPSLLVTDTFVVLLLATPIILLLVLDKLSKL